MRVAVWHNLPHGGGARALRDQVRGLISRGHKVEMWCPESATGVHPDYFADTVKPRVLPLPVSRSSRWSSAVPAKGLGSRSRLPGAGTVRSLNQHAREVAEEIMAGGFDVVFSGSCFILGSPPLARYLNLPSVLYLQEPNRSLYEAPSAWAPAERNSDLKGRLKSAYKLLVAHRMRELVIEEIANAQAFDRILVNSRYSVEAVSRAYALPARICSLGLDTDEWVTNGSVLPGAEPVVVGIGTLGPHKAVDLAVAAVGAVQAAERPELRWLCNRADPAYRSEVQRLAAASDVRLTIREGLGSEELRRELAAARMLVAAARLEPFGYTPLEAAALGVPTVAVAEGGFRETIVDGWTGLLVERDPVLMGRAITTLLRDPQLARRLGEQARIGVRERWSMAAATDAVEQYLQEASRSASKTRSASEA